MLTKNRTCVTIIAFLCLHFIFACGNQLPERDVKIMDVRNSSEPAINLSAHKPYDVEVFREHFMADVYKVRYYHVEQNKLVSHEATYESKLDLDKAQCIWMSDTSVAIRLHNDVTNQELRFRVFGKGPRSGISEQLK